MSELKKKNKAKFSLAIVEFFLVVFLIDFFLSQIQTDGIIEWAILSFCLLFLGSFFIIKYILRESVKAYFLAVNFSLKALLASFTVAILYVGVLLLFVVQLGWKGSMPVSSWVLGTTELMIFFNIFIVPLVVFSKEFFFRGFLMKSFIGFTGIFGAIVLQAILATFYEAYLGGILDYKQIILLFLPNIFLGYIAYINRSIIISALFSWVYLLAIDFIFAYNLSH